MSQIRYFQFRYPVLMCAVLLLVQVKLYAGNDVPEKSKQQADSIKITLCRVTGIHDDGEIRYYSLSDWNRYEGDITMEYNPISSITLKNKKVKDSLLSILENYYVPGDEMHSLLERFGVGKEINTLPDSCFRHLYEGKFSDMLQWNGYQVKYLADSLRKESVRIRLLNKYLEDFQYEDGGKVYNVELFRNGEVQKWVTLSGRDFYRGEIEEFLQGKLDTEGKVPEILPYSCGMDLLKIMAKKYVDRWPNAFYSLGWYDCEEVYKRLEKNFIIKEKCQFLDNWNVKYGGRYIDNRVPEYMARLSVKDGNPNVQLMFLYSSNADFNRSITALENSHKSVVERICSIPFIKKNVVDAGIPLRIWYFNARNVNDYLHRLAVEGLRRAKIYGVWWEDLENSVLVEFRSNKGLNMYLALPDGRLVMLIENNWHGNYASVVINLDGTRVAPK